MLQNPKEVANTEEQRRRKLERFLQFHDQKTAGIPGLLPLFIDMKGRVTEKIARGHDDHGRDVVILKHTSCTIYGWDLATSDRKHAHGSQRLLDYLPKVIYLHFEGAEWQIHPHLPKGVFPLQSVQRTWKLSESGSKVTRRGFTLVPDYASTGFMTQGETLLAEIAECGDIFSVPGMTEILTTYVIFSRVKKADALLLLRAFSPNLFRFGSPPGPACLIKHLRRRLGAPAELTVTPYTKEDATHEYFAKSAQWDREKKVRKARGLEWPCAFCGLHFPASGFLEGSRRSTSNQPASRDAIQEFCIAPGHARRLMCMHAHVVLRSLCACTESAVYRRTHASLKRSLALLPRLCWNSIGWKYHIRDRRCHSTVRGVLSAPAAAVLPGFHRTLQPLHTPRGF